MIEFVIDQNLSESTYAKNIALSGIPVTVSEAALAVSTHADIYWRWADEVTSQPHFLGKVAAGHVLSVPFPNPTGRSIQIFAVSKTAAGVPNVRVITEATSKIFTIDLPQITSLTYVPPTVTGEIQDNGGTGDIHILRSVDAITFTEIDVVAYTVTSFTDTPDAGATYYYKLTQDGFAGESSVISIFAYAAGSDAPPTLTSATFSTPNVNLVFARNGSQTGDIRILRKGSTGDYSEIASVAYSATSYSDTSITLNDTYTYKLSQDGVSGYSAEHSAVVSGLGGGGGTGSTPDGLSATVDYTSDAVIADVYLTWTNHGGTGNNVIESRIGIDGSFSEADIEAASATTAVISEVRSGTNYTVQYRVRNESATGYSNTISVTIRREVGGF
jgi:hypothetical protein